LLFTVSVLPNILTPVSGKNEKLPLSVTHPELAQEADGWDATLINQGSHKKLLWKCHLGHSYESVVSNRALQGKGCAVCKNKKVLAGFNDLATTHPQIAQQADGWDPTTVVAGSDKKREWLCEVGHTYTASPNSRTQSRGGTGCAVCTNKKLLVGFNDLATTHPEVAGQAYGWDPTTVIAGTHLHQQWICEFGHIWNAEIKSRTTGGNGCSICSNQSVMPGVNDFATTHPQLISEVDEWDPTKYVAGTSELLDWKCPFGHRWKAKGSDRTKGNQTGCPTCSKTGFDPNEPGFLYFLHQPDWSMYQIGITNNFKNRFQRHRKNGWKLIEVSGPIDGLLAKKWESAILTMLKAKGADLSNIKIAGKFDGYSEAWSKATFEVKSIKELMKLTEEFEDESKD
jgi:Probable Zinc-ribbon domain